MGVRDYSAKSFINDILLKDSNEPILSSSAQKSLETSLSFVSYLYKNKQHIEDGKLACFPLSVQDAKGNKTWHKGNEEEKKFNIDVEEDVDEIASVHMLFIGEEKSDFQPRLPTMCVRC